MLPEWLYSKRWPSNVFDSSLEIDDLSFCALPFQKLSCTQLCQATSPKCWGRAHQLRRYDNPSPGSRVFILADLGGVSPNALTPFIRMLKWTIMPKFESSQMFKEHVKNKTSIELASAKLSQSYYICKIFEKSKLVPPFLSNLGEFWKQQLTNLHLNLSRSPPLVVLRSFVLPQGWRGCGTPQAKKARGFEGSCQFNCFLMITRPPWFRGFHGFFNWNVTFFHKSSMLQ